MAKTRHHKRRIVQSAFVQVLRGKLKIGGIFHMVTDWKNCAEHMVGVVNVAYGDKNAVTSGTYIPRPEDRPLTKFEAHGYRLGHGVWDIKYVRIE